MRYLLLCLFVASCSFVHQAEYKAAFREDWRPVVLKGWDDMARDHIGIQSKGDTCEVLGARAYQRDLLLERGPHVTPSESFDSMLCEMDYRSGQVLLTIHQDTMYPGQEIHGVILGDTLFLELEDETKRMYRYDPP